MRYIYSDKTDPYYNLALEQFVFDELDKSDSYFMLWQNHNSIIVGKHQNTAGEINADYVRENNIRVARRLSGGGAVYHDMGNLNFTFIADADSKNYDFATFCQPVIAALAQLGVKAEVSGRNDMTIDGKKFSGNAQYMRKGRIMHHGTIMFDSNLEILTEALNVSPDKIQSKGIKSIKSRVTNVKPHVQENLTVGEFWETLRKFVFEQYGCTNYILSAEEERTVEKLRDERYSLWEWSYGASPAYSIQKKKRFDGCGTIQVEMDVKEGRIENIAFSGDYFGDDADGLVERLKGCKLEYNELDNLLHTENIGIYFTHLTTSDFISLLLG